MVHLRTKRLLISDHARDDIQPMHRLLSDPVAMYYLQDIKTNTLQGSLQNLSAAMSEIGLENRKKYFFKIEYSDSREYIGEIGFTVRLDTPLGKIVGLGYFILPEFWGKGIVSEAASEVIRFAFEEANVIKVETGCIRENEGSEKVMQKVGMIKEADYKMRVWHDNRLKDRVEYRLLKDEWEQQGKL